MNLHFNNLINSFKRLKLEFIYTFAVDLLFWVIFIGAIKAAGDYIKRRSLQFSGMDQAALQNMISANPQQAEAFLSGLKGFLISYILIIGAIVIGGLLLYSLSRGIIWNYLLNKKITQRTYWRWNVLNPILFIGLMIWVVLLVTVKGLLQLISSGQYYIFVVSLIIISLFFTGWLFIQFSIYKNFTLNYKVFLSIGNAFDDIKRKIKGMSYKYLYSNAIFILFYLLLIPFRNSLFLLKNISLIEGFLVLIYIAWLRIYLADG